jgi:hypothetical protein
MTLSEENYLKAIYHLTIVSNADVLIPLLK